MCEEQRSRCHEAFQAVEHPVGKKSHTSAKGGQATNRSHRPIQCNKEVVELPQISLAGLIIAGPPLFVKVLKSFNKYHTRRCLDENNSTA